MKRFLATAVMTVFLAFACIGAAPSKNFFKSIQPVQDRHEDGTLHTFCTAWALQSDAPIQVWVTKAHCITDSKVDIDKFLIGGRPVRVTSINQELDLATFAGPDAPGLRVAYGGPAVSDPVYMWGYPDADGGYSAGVVFNPSLRDGKYAVFNMAGGPGSSGSPIMVKGDLVVSVLTGGAEGGFTPFVYGNTTKQLRLFLFGE